MTSGRVITDMARGIGEAVYVTAKKISNGLETAIKAQREGEFIKEYLER